MRSTTSEKVIEYLEKIFTTHGLPLSLRSDNGPQFRLEVFEKYLEDNGMEQRKTTPLWPQANGEMERQDLSLLKRMKIAQATTGVSPAELLFGRKMRTKLEREHREHRE